MKIRPLCVGIGDMTIPDIPEGDPEYSDPFLHDLPKCIRHSVQWLHFWAKNGVIPQHVFEQRLNSYLAVPLLMEDNLFIRKKPWMAVMDAEDTPCFENNPDLWGIMRDTLKNILYPKKKLLARNMLHILFTQALPCFHQTNKSVQVDEYMPVVLNVLLALLLGLYKNANKKSHFMLRIQFFKKIHVLMTSTKEAQQEFFSQHSSLIILSFMEYIAQVTPMFWPAEYEFLVKENNMSAFFDKIPLICDDFRVFDMELSWARLEEQADIKIHKCSRTRRLNKCEYTESSKKHIPCDESLFLQCPVLNRRNLKECDWYLLAHAYQLPVSILRDGHNLIQVFELPENIKQLQVENMSKMYACVRLRYICSRLFVCVKCAYMKNSLHSKFRLHVHEEQIICSECLCKNVVSVDMMGRSVLALGVTYILCPICCKVHPYKGDGMSWIADCPLHEKKMVVPEVKCDICEDSNVTVYERINHLTGHMEKMGLCYKHQPSDQVLNHCVNIRQMRNLQIRRSWVSRGTKKPVYDY